MNKRLSIFTQNEIKDGNIFLNNWLEDILRDLAQDNEIRICTECDSIMVEGYCIEDGLEYYCSDDCLNKNITDEEFEELYDNGDGSTYYTEWSGNRAAEYTIKKIIEQFPEIKIKIKDEIVI